ncbi:SYNERG-CTERM sorting domain-containing protein [bacterium]|nr:SYNERG-CTERM sorting domain-containing protein [bacterium]
MSGLSARKSGSDSGCAAGFAVFFVFLLLPSLTKRYGTAIIYTYKQKGGP